LRFTIHSTVASRTVPTLNVLVMRIGVSRHPGLLDPGVPVMSPFPFPA
jgi:hypothetical protein